MDPKEGLLELFCFFVLSNLTTSFAKFLQKQLVWSIDFIPLTNIIPAFTNSTNES